MNVTLEEKTLSSAETTRLEQLKKSLDAASAHYTIIANELGVHSAADGVEQGFGALDQMAPTFILRSESGYLAAIIRGDTRLAYKKIKRQLRLKDLCLATPEQVRQVSGAEVGYVSLVNPGLTTLVDSQLTSPDAVYGGCGVPRHTLKIAPADLVALTQAQVFDFTESKEIGR